MPDAAHPTAEIPRDEEMLGQLAEMDLALAREVFVAARAAETPGEMAELVRAYQRVARSTRQSLALLDRFRRARAAGERPAPPAAPPPDPPSEAALARKAQVRTALRRLIWNETEREACDHALRDLDVRLEIHARRPGFAEAPFEPQLRAFATVFGLDPDAAPQWRDLPDPPRAQAAPEPAVLSSA